MGAHFLGVAVGAFPGTARRREALPRWGAALQRAKKARVVCARQAVARAQDACAVRAWALLRGRTRSAADLRPALRLGVVARGATQPPPRGRGRAVGLSAPVDAGRRRAGLGARVRSTDRAAAGVVQPVSVGGDLRGRVPQGALPRQGRASASGARLAARGPRLGSGGRGRGAQGQGQRARAVESGGVEMHGAQAQGFLGRVLVVAGVADLGLEVRGHGGTAPQPRALGTAAPVPPGEGQGWSLVVGPAQERRPRLALRAGCRSGEAVCAREQGARGGSRVPLVGGRCTHGGDDCGARPDALQALGTAGPLVAPRVLASLVHRPLLAALPSGGATCRARLGRCALAIGREPRACDAAQGAPPLHHDSQGLVDPLVPDAGAEGPASILAGDMVVPAGPRPGAASVVRWVALTAAAGLIAVLLPAGGPLHHHQAGWSVAEAASDTRVRRTHRAGAAAVHGGADAPTETARDLALTRQHEGTWGERRVRAPPAGRLGASRRAGLAVVLVAGVSLDDKRRKVKSRELCAGKGEQVTAHSSSSSA